LEVCSITDDDGTRWPQALVFVVIGFAVEDKEIGLLEGVNVGK
jgi:hypothetical protein